MKIDNIEIQYFIDYLNNKMHVLSAETSTYSFGNLPNSIGPEFQKKLVEQEHLLMDVLDYEWVCYCSNGLILAYKSYSLQLINKNEKWLHEPFLSVIEGG